MVLQFSHLNDLRGLSVAYSVCNYGHILYRFQDIAIIGRKRTFSYPPPICLVWSVRTP